MPHATIVQDLWGRRDAGLKLTYRGDDSRGRFPLDAITEGFSVIPQKGPMRFITVGPYELTKNISQNRVDSITFIYAVGSGGTSYQLADSIGKAWINGTLTDSVKNLFIQSGKDSLFKVLDNANWAWKRLSSGLSIPAAPPSPDINVKSDVDRNIISWSYPEATYFNDAVTGVDDWYSWRVYKKRGAAFVNDPLDQGSRDTWELVFETTEKNLTSYADTNVVRGLDYYYAVTAVDNGTQNDGIFPGTRLESSRYVNRTQLPVVPFKQGLTTLEENQVRVVPNPYTRPVESFGTPNKISFFNLPYKATLNIFTETGDLVKTIEHEGDADSEWDQRTDENQFVSSGIYVLAITNAQSFDGKGLKNQYVKFIIVR
jgi:hypothetical protein